MKNIELNKNLLLIEKENAIPMIDGYDSDMGEKNAKCTIFAASKNAKSIQSNFEKFPKLISIKKNNPRANFPLSSIGEKFQKQEYENPMDIVAVLDKIYHLGENNIKMWTEICSSNNNLFSQWKDIAEYNSSQEIKNPVLLLLRLYKIEHPINSDLLEDKRYFCQFKEKTSCNLLNPLIDSLNFGKITTKLENIINPFLIKKETFNDTICWQI